MSLSTRSPTDGHVGHYRRMTALIYNGKRTDLEHGEVLPRTRSKSLNQSSINGRLRLLNQKREYNINYDLQNVEADLDDKNVSMVSNALVGTLSIAMGKITKENGKSFIPLPYDRTIHGAWLQIRRAKAHHSRRRSLTLVYAPTSLPYQC